MANYLWSIPLHQGNKETTVNEKVRESGAKSTLGYVYKYHFLTGKCVGGRRGGLVFDEIFHRFQ